MFKVGGLVVCNNSCVYHFKDKGRIFEIYKFGTHFIFARPLDNPKRLIPFYPEELDPYIPDQTGLEEYTWE